MTTRIEVKKETSATALTMMKEELLKERAYSLASVQPFDPKRKLSHQELFALPDAQRFQYYDAHGGVLAVMKENGYGLTDEDIKDWNQYKEERDKELAALTWEEALKRIYGQT